MTMRTLLVCGGLLAATACAAEPAHERYQRASASVETVRVEMPVDPRRNGLSWEQTELVQALAGEYKTRGRGAFVVSYPQDAGNAEAALAAIADVRTLLNEQGLDWRNIGGGAYRAAGEDFAPVVFSFEAYRAVAANCDMGWDDMRLTGQGRGWRQFGCATESNIAAMVANPRDLGAAQDTDPADAIRRQTVIDRWREGEATASQRSGDERGTVSDAVGN